MWAGMSPVGLMVAVWLQQDNMTLSGQSGSHIAFIGLGAGRPPGVHAPGKDARASRMSTVRWWYL
jgi:hypothetical protein